MSPAGQNNLLRNIGAVLAGLVAIFVLDIGTDNALRAVGIFPAIEFSTPKYPRLSDLFDLFATIYRAVYAIIGCYITARLAQPAHATCSCAGIDGRRLEHSWRSGNPETWTRVWTTLVSSDAHPDFTTLRVDRRKAGSRTRKDLIRAIGFFALAQPSRL